MNTIHGKHHKIYGHYRKRNEEKTNGDYRITARKTPCFLWSLPQGKNRGKHHKFYGHYRAEKTAVNTITLKGKLRSAYVTLGR